MSQSPIVFANSARIALRISPVATRGQRIPHSANPRSPNHATGQRIPHSSFPRSPNLAPRTSPVARSPWPAAPNGLAAFPSGDAYPCQRPSRSPTTLRSPRTRLRWTIVQTAPMTQRNPPLTFPTLPPSRPSRPSRPRRRWRPPTHQSRTPPVNRCRRQMASRRSRRKTLRRDRSRSPLTSVRRFY